MKEKIEKFIYDEAMFETVFSAIQSSFLKARGSKDVQYLAAKSLSIELLEEAKKELARLRGVEDGTKGNTQIGM